MSLSFLATGYEHINRGGLQRLFGVGKSARYNHINEAMLGSLSFDAILSSLQVSASSDTTANVVLFSNTALDFFDVGNFAGDFRQVVAAKGGAANFVNITDFGFNDRTRSLLLVNTGRGLEFRVSFRDKFLDTWNETLDAELGSDASRKGDPLMTWAAFPEGVSYLSDGQIYLQITQALNINIDWWPDYDASITYHLYLYLDGANKLQGYCQRWSAWVESGIKSGGILDRLWPKVVAGTTTINNKLRENFASLPSFKDFYYLPGRQIGAISGVGSGTTWDDVTLVFEL
ncbi:MAG: hypothetical protein QOF48_2885 [Verrucomicrobiota bacterium]|jgi:hypothetical protein